MSTVINHHITPTRRFALGFSAAAFSAGFTTPVLASPPPNRDAKLLRLCADFRRQHRLVLDLAKPSADQPEDALDWAMIKRWGISNKIQAIAAMTDAGRKAKAEVAIALIEENRNFAGMDGDIQFAYSVLLDLAGPSALIATSGEG